MSMELFIQNNDNLAPREEVTIERLAATPFPDRTRVKVAIDVTPFRERPNLEIAIIDQDGKRLTGTSVIAAMQFRMEFTLHLRGLDAAANALTVHVVLYYDDIQSPQDTGETTFDLPSVDSAAGP